MKKLEIKLKFKITNDINNDQRLQHHNLFNINNHGFRREGPTTSTPIL